MGIMKKSLKEGGAADHRFRNSLINYSTTSLHVNGDAYLVICK